MINTPLRYGKPRPPVRPSAGDPEFLHLVFDSGAAEQLGPNGMALMCLVAVRGPVAKMLDTDIDKAIGLHGMALRRARDRAVECGWLRHEPINRCYGTYSAVDALCRKTVTDLAAAAKRLAEVKPDDLAILPDHTKVAMRERLQAMLVAVGGKAGA